MKRIILCYNKVMAPIDDSFDIRQTTSGEQNMNRLRINAKVDHESMTVAQGLEKIKSEGVAPFLDRARSLYGSGAGDLSWRDGYVEIHQSNREGRQEILVLPIFVKGPEGEALTSTSPKEYVVTPDGAMHRITRERAGDDPTY
jgi:hypothetical protein